MNSKKLTSKFISILAVVSLMISVVSCSETETTDSTKFMIYYTGVTDIGPSMNFKLNGPSYKGAAPSDFAITKVTYENEVFTNESFIIDTNSGSISISNTAELPVGVYRISISCISNGNFYEFNDAIEVNMMAPVPDGVTVEPALVVVDYNNIKAENKTAQVKTDGNHVSIIGYEVIQESTKNYFAVSKTGEISINQKFTGDIPPGMYKVSLKLTTNAGKCIYEDAVTFNIISAPVELSYSPDNKGSIEKNHAFESPIPTLKGSLEELVYSIKKVTPATDKFSINPATGVLSVSTDNNLEVGASYTIDINVANKYGNKDFDGAYTIEVVDFIAPIENFSYSNKESVENTKIEISPNEGLIGGMVTFSLENLPAALNGQLTIDPENGKITAKKGNSIPMGNYVVKVKASNVKGEVITEFTLTVKENTNKFTYIRFGNNLGLSPIENYANQFRVRTEQELRNLKIKPNTDARGNADLEWSVNAKYKMKDIAIDSKTGELTFADVPWREAVNNKNYLAIVTGGMVIVNATAGKGTDAEFTLSVPVFFHLSAPIEKEKDINTLVSTGVTIEYSPFVFQVNPALGGKSVAPVINGANLDQFSLDYRRSFNYWNLGASHKDGAPAISSGAPTNFMGELWDRYFKSLINQTTNTGSKDPLSYFSNIDGKFGKNLGLALGYVDHTDNFKVNINPNKWRGDDNVYANGVMTGQMTFVTNSNNGTGINNGAGTIAFFVWFDEKF